MRRAVGRNATVPDLSCEGIQRIVAALAAQGVTVHWDDETDYETYVDLHLRPVNAEVPLTLSWRGTTGWVLTEHADPRRDWKIDATDLDEVAAEVAGAPVTRRADNWGAPGCSLLIVAILVVLIGALL